MEASIGILKLFCDVDRSTNVTAEQIDIVVTSHKRTDGNYMTLALHPLDMSAEKQITVSVILTEVECKVLVGFIQAHL